MRRKTDDTWDFMLDHDKHIGYIRITAFSRDTAADVKRALEELNPRGSQGADPRPAFQPRRAVELGHRSERSVHLQRQDRQHRGPQHTEAHLGGPERGHVRGLPDGVLVNHYSASASEIRGRRLAGPRPRGHRGRTNLGQRERAERHRAGKRKKRPEADHRRLSPAQRQEYPSLSRCQGKRRMGRDAQRRL